MAKLGNTNRFISHWDLEIHGPFQFVLVYLLAPLVPWFIFCTIDFLICFSYLCIPPLYYRKKSIALGHRFSNRASSDGTNYQAHDQEHECTFHSTFYLHNCTGEINPIWSPQMWFKYSFNVTLKSHVRGESASPPSMLKWWWKQNGMQVRG